MTDKPSSKPRLLFIVSNDFGELSNALYFLKGNDFPARLLLPEKLFAVNRGDLITPSVRYQALPDILSVVADFRPDAVFLFSGYLFSVNRVLPLTTVENLVSEICSKSCRVITSDPFLGLMSNLDAGAFGGHPLRNWLADHFARLFDILKGLPHLYLVDIGTSSKTCNVSFFNSNLVAPISIPAALTDRNWLFILSFEDYGRQVARVGKATFDNLLIQKLRETILAGRRPVLVAPGPCLEAVGDRMLSSEDLALVHFCSYSAFQQLLMKAEYAFYWNVLSDSLVARVFNRLPVFFFDRGHLVTALPGLWDAAMKFFYPRTVLPFLDQNEVLVADELSKLGTTQAAAFTEARANFQSSPSPEELISSLLIGNSLKHQQV